MAPRFWLAAVAVLFLAPVPASAGDVRAATSGEEFVRQTRAFMRKMAAGNAVDARRIERAYGPIAEAESLADRDGLVEAIATGRILPLPEGASARTLLPRTAGPHPIGEMDLPHQHLYLAAHPATLEALLRLASSVSTGTVEVTSLVRHREYQRRLARTNVNAARRASMHTLGLAFDVSVLNVPPATAREIADVLLAMRRAGDIYFVAETQQLVFHVVPTPARLDNWTAVRADTGAAGEPRLLPAPPRYVTTDVAPVSLLIVPPSATRASAVWSIPIGAGLLACAARMIRRVRRA